MTNKKKNKTKTKQQSLPSSCSQCKAPDATSQCRCGAFLCSPGKNPQCYFNHSLDMLSIDTDNKVHISDRHPICGVNPSQFLGDSANQGSMYGQESGSCIKCQQESTKRCKHCSVFVCRPTENSRICMAVHLKEKHKIEPVFWIM